jgi:hypothetical protein
MVLPEEAKAAAVPCVLSFRGRQTSAPGILGLARPQGGVEAARASDMHHDDGAAPLDVAGLGDPLTDAC